MSEVIDLYWSFRSPYSYLSTRKILALRDKWNIEVKVKIVLPLALREDGFFESRGPQWLGYLLRDVTRLAEMSGQVLAMPNPDPVTTDPTTGKFAKDQPLVRHLSRLGVLASDAGKGLEFLNEVGTLVWSGKNWLEDNSLAKATARTGLDLAELEGKMQPESETAALDARIHQHDKDLRAAGHWGVPTLVIRGEPFFGQDRIDVLEWRLGKLGVAKKN